MNKEVLKKHHFWILLGLTPLMVLIAVITITSGVGAAIDAKNAEIKKAKDELSSKTSPKPNDLLNKLDGQIDKLGKKKTSLWQENWERQIGFREVQPGVSKQNAALNLYPWPKSNLLNRFNYGPDYLTNKDALKFGDPIPSDDGEFDEFRKVEVYLAQYSNPKNAQLQPGMADRIAPTQFNGGWEKILRHVQTPAGWGTNKPLNYHIWLALEDIWVQRAMLEAVRSVNTNLAAFERAGRDEKGAELPDLPLERTFYNATWRLSLKAAPRETDSRYVMTGKLTNLTDRLQVLGVGNTMTLKVWLSKDAAAPAFDFRVSGEYVPGGGTMDILTTEDHVLAQGVTPTSLERVEQVFDVRTVPVRRIDRLVLNYTDSRNAAVALKPPLFIPAAPAAADAGAAGGLGGGGAGGSSLGPTGGSGSGPPAMGGAGIGGAGGGAAGGGASGGGSPGNRTYEGGGDVIAVLENNKKRYVGDPTDQVRRMPVAVVLVIDQASLQDVLVAYANSPLRFQIAQVHWQRFRGTINSGPAGGASSGGSGDDVALSGKGSQGDGFVGGSSLGPKPGGGSSLGPMPGGGAPPGPPPSGGMGSGIGGGGGPPATVSEQQLTAGLIEVTIYGTISLYEKYKPDAPPDAK